MQLRTVVVVGSCRSSEVSIDVCGLAFGPCRASTTVQYSTSFWLFGARAGASHRPPKPESDRGDRTFGWVRLSV